MVKAYRLRDHELRHQEIATNHIYHGKKTLSSNLLVVHINSLSYTSCCVAKLKLFLDSVKVNIHYSQEAKN
jgi:hypothetical protein